MKALVVAPQPFFSPRGTPFSVYYRTMILSELGVEVDLLTYGEGEDVIIPNVNIIRIPRFKFLGSVKLGPSFLKLFLDFFLFGKFISRLTKNKYDFVHAHEEAVFMALFLKPIFNFKLVYDVHSSLPQQLKNFQFSSSKLLLRIFEKLEKASLKKADAVITICPDLRDYVNKIIDKKEKHFLIENSIFESVKTVGSKTVDDDETLSSKILSNINGDKIVAYAGTLEKYQGIDILIRSFRTVLEKSPNTKLLIVGGTKEQVESFSKLASELKISENVIFTGRVSQRIAKKINIRADVLVSPRISGTNTPLKIYEQISSGKPLVATNIYSHTQVLDNNVAFLVDPDSDSMANGIIESLKSDVTVSQKVKNAKRLFEENYSRDVYISKMKKLLELLR